MLLESNSPPIKAGLLFYILLYLAVSACTPAHRFARTYSVEQAEISEKVIPEYLRKGRLSSDHQKTYRIYKNWVAGTDEDPSLFKKINRYKPSKLYGPYLDSDSTVYFLQKLKTLSPRYLNFALAQIQQNFGMSDELFQEELDRIKALCLRKKQTLPEVLKTYESPDRPNIGLSVEMKATNTSELLPDFVAFAEKAKRYEVYQTEKVEMQQLTLIELIQKIDHSAVKQQIEYIKVVLWQHPIQNAQKK